MEPLTTRYPENLVGVLSCYDRIVITGTLPGACFADGMTSFLYSRGIRIFDYPQFALPLRERIRANAATVAAEHVVTIEHIAKTVNKSAAGSGCTSSWLPHAMKPSADWIWGPLLAPWRSPSRKQPPWAPAHRAGRAQACARPVCAPRGADRRDRPSCVQPCQARQA